MGTWFGPSEKVANLPVGDFREKPVESTSLKAIVLRMDRNVEYMQAEIRKVLDGLNKIEGLKIGDKFTMTIDDSNMMDSNEYKLVLEFERQRDDPSK